MYKIIHRYGHEVESDFDNLKDAMERLWQLKSMGVTSIYVVDACTRVGKKLKAKK